jgi:hypothetical protein
LFYTCRFFGHGSARKGKEKQEREEEEELALKKLKVEEEFPEEDRKNCFEDLPVRFLVLIVSHDGPHLYF